MQLTSHVDDLEELVERNASSAGLIIFGTSMYSPLVYFKSDEPILIGRLPGLPLKLLITYSREARKWFNFVAEFVDGHGGFTTIPEIADELGGLHDKIIRTHVKSLLERAARVIDRSVSTGVDKFRELPNRDESEVYGILSVIADFWAHQSGNYRQNSGQTYAATEAKTVMNAIFFAALTRTKVQIFSNEALSLFFLRNIYESILSDELFRQSRAYGIMHDTLPRLRKCDVEIVCQDRILSATRELTAPVNLSTAYLREEHGH
ncbi:hypothetical protein HYU10_00500 [Candidatus Woesearchaeota archaeon]|nr:hypothetical protein [Candidatus Woesearchaeota archaeon]